MGSASMGIDPTRLTDVALRRELTNLHQTRHDVVLGGSEDALQMHTERMLALEQEFLHRYPREGAPDPMRTRAGGRKAAGQN